MSVVAAHVDPGALLEVVEALARELHGDRAPRVDLDAELERELGLGSLERMELARRIEQRFAVTMDERLVARAETPRDLLDAALARRHEPGAPAPLATGGRARAPEHASTLVDVLEWHAAEHGDRVHVRVLADDGTHEDVTYAALLDRARELAAGLAARGARPGDTIGLMLPTSRAYFEAFCAVLLAGAIPVPLYPPARLARAADHLRRQGRILARAEAGLLVAAPEVRLAARALAGSAPRLREVVTTDQLAGESATAPARNARPDEVALVQFTSGSTGDPKGVVLTHANLLANIRSMGEAIEATPDDVFVSWLPLYHDMGLIGAWMGSLTYGFPLVVMSPLAFLARPVRWLRAIDQHRGTISAAPNFAYEICATKIDDDDLRGLDLSSWRLAVDGAEPISARTLRRFAERFAAHGLRASAMFPVYGLAECSVGLAFPPLGRGPIVDRVRRDELAREGRAVPAVGDEPRGDGSGVEEIVGCGRALPRHAMRIVDERGLEVAERVVGRIEFRGPSATRGYLHDAEASRRLFHGEWLDSGDLGYFVDREVFLTGRVKDLVIRAGRNLHPHEIEETAGLVSGVRRGSVAAFASPDPRDRTERLVVVAETRERDPAQRERLRARIAAAITERVEVPPDEVVLAPPHAVFKTSSGKIRRAATREAWERGELGGAESVRGRARSIGVAAGAAGVVLARRARALVDLLFAAWAWAVLLAGACAAWLLLALVPGRHRRRRAARATARLVARATGTPIGLEGAEHLPRDRACVLVSNHASYLDSLLLLAALPATLDYAFVAKGELAERAITRAPLRRLGVEMVRRWDVASSLEDARHLEEVVRSGRSLLVYPEATTEPFAGILPFRMGAFVVATAALAPVVPLVVRGTRAMLPPGRWRPRRGAARVTIGAPLAPRGASFEDAVELRQRTRAWIVAHAEEPDRVDAWEPAREAAAAGATARTRGGGRRAT